jgi:hypothetical protein
MRNIFKLLGAGLAGLVSTQASAAESFEKELYESTIEQGTIEAAEVFLQSFPNSVHAEEVGALLDSGIRSQLRSGRFQSAISNVAVTYDAAGFASHEASPSKKAKRQSRRSKRSARRAENREARKERREARKERREKKRERRRKRRGGHY